MKLRIRQLREDLGLTQLQLAEMAGLSRSQLAMIEAGTRNVNNVRLQQIAKALGVSEVALYESSAELDRLAQILPSLTGEDRAALVRMAEALAARPR